MGKEEGEKCLNFSGGISCVWHLMKVVEGRFAFIKLEPYEGEGRNEGWI